MTKKSTVPAVNVNELFMKEIDTPEKLVGSEKSIALFKKVSATVTDSILINRVISARSVFKLTEKQFLILKTLYGMNQGDQFTFSELTSKVFKAMKKGSQVNNGNSSAWYYTLKDAVKDSDIIRAIMLLAGMGNKLHLTLNKNGALSVQRNDNRVSLLSASFFVENQIDEETVSRKTVAFLPEFVEQYRTAIVDNGYALGSAQFNSYCERVIEEAKKSIGAPAEKIAQ